MKKILLGGILGGLVLFVWSFIAHMPPVGTAGYGAVPAAQEEQVIGALRGAMTKRAIYVLPRIDVSHTLAPEEQRAWTARYEAGPSAVVVYDPHPANRGFAGSVFASQLVVELVTAVLAALLGAVIAFNLSSALGYWPRVLVLAAVGLLATIDVDASYWSWYGFPTSFLLAQFADHGGGWLLAGLVLARVGRAGAESTPR